MTRQIGRHRIAVYRTADGEPHALNARCAHLGANLGDGKVVGLELRCPFHRWAYGPDGRCTDIPYRESGALPCTANVFSYPTIEKFGAIWVFNGPEPLFPAPSLPDEDGARVVRFRPREIPIHPHIMVPNALDVLHLQAVHGLELLSHDGVETPSPWEVRSRMTWLVPRDFRRHWLYVALGISEIELTITAYGGNTALLEVIRPRRLSLVVTHTPLEKRVSVSRTFALFLQGRRLLPVTRVQRLLDLASLIPAYRIMREDRKVLSRMQFWPHTTPEDASMNAFIRVVTGMPTFDPSPARIGPRL